MYSLTRNPNPKKQPHYYKQQTGNGCLYDPLWANKCPCPLNIGHKPRNRPQKAAQALKQRRIGA